MLNQIVTEIGDRPLFVVGVPKAGKTVFTKIIADELLKQGSRVRAFDGSLAWWHSCPLPQRYSVEYSDEVHLVDGCLFDVGRLPIEERSQIIQEMVEGVYSARYEMKLRSPEFMEKTPLDVTILEESQSMFRKYGDLGRLQDWASMGRNYRMSAVHTTQRAAEARTEMLERCNLLVGYTTHDNNLKKLARATSDEFMKRLKRIKSGSYEFLYYNGDTYGPFTVSPRVYGVPVTVKSVWDISTPRY